MAVKPAKAAKCGVVGQIMLVAIAVAVSIYTAGALAGPLSSTILAGALGGAAGSIASQAVGVATGIQDKFSFKGVAMAAISGGVGAGLGTVGALTRIGGSEVLGGAVRGALGSALSQGAAVAVRLQDRLDWAGVAVGAVGGAVGTVMNGFAGPLRGGSLAYYGTKAATGMTAAIAGAAARTLLNGSSFGDNIIAVLPEVIGTTIGNAVIDGIALRSVAGGSARGTGGGSDDSEPGDLRYRAQSRLLNHRGGNIQMQGDGSITARGTVGFGTVENIVVTARRPGSWLAERAHDLIGGHLNWLVNNNPMTLTMQAGGAASRFVGATGVARHFDNGAAFARGYWRGVGYGVRDAVGFGYNLVTQPGPTLRGAVLGTAAALDRTIMANPSDVRDSIRQTQRELVNGGPAAWESAGEGAGRVAVDTVGLAVRRLEEARRRGSGGRLSARCPCQRRSARRRLTPLPE